MAEFTLDDLRRILRAGAGVDEQTDLDGEHFADTAFADLGYDSLALLELVNRVEREYGIGIPDGDLAHTQSPREVLAYVHAKLREARV
ncbi:acyl carrier protein [Streptomyces prunicolor]|jgi:acyl carrier protein|uniref:Acyl carrier protein n=1 Tax=Streptomyces prunicolor TaxID=67348 RepID=A0ABU4FQM8_9ACTN|nr:acyl carrier protein [Streptomyces prunicolor]MCX5235482.1 acyl carrier protein [Streptomyces prunicolor]MDV7222880.1 acyl carrier protein [Streptomyces prunicolor]